MYKLLIVDDEPLVQVGIKSMLNWQELNIEICGTVANGEQALELMQNAMPDIVITDIKMPIMDGLSLLKQCRETFGYGAPVFVMLTSYEDFHMAKEAITYQAIGYLVKVELTPELLKETVRKAIETIEQRQSGSSDASTLSTPSGSLYSYTEKFMISLLNNLFESEEQMFLQAEHLKIDISHSGYMCCYGSFETGSNSANRDKLLTQFESSLQMIHELAGKYIPCHTLALDISHFALIYCFNENDATLPQDRLWEMISGILSRIRTSLQNYYNVSIRCGIGSFSSSPMALTESYQQARLAYRQTDSKTPIIYLPNRLNVPHDTFNISLFKTDLTRAFEEYDSILLKDTIHSLCELLDAHPHHFVQALDAASNILYLSLSLLHDGEQTLTTVFKDSADGYLSLYRQTNVAQITSWLGFLAEELGKLFDERRKDYKNRIVIDVKSYILEHLYEKLTLNEVAAHFAISSCYLSQLFSKYSDSGFTEYINTMKIKEAKHLLREEHRKVYEVAEMLSFGSEFYFSKVFKKVEGISPTDFLNSLT